MRNFFAKFGGGSGGLVVAGLCVLLLAAGFYVQSGRNQLVTPVETAAPQSPKAVDPAGDTSVVSKAVSEQPAADPAVEKTEEPAEVPAVQPETTQTETQAARAADQEATAEAAPAFDEVRRDADGVTVIAGRAAPGAEVSVLQDGKVIASAKADRTGKFATIAMIAPDGQGHVLSLLAQGAGVAQPSQGEIILAPAAPVVAAAVDTAGPETEVADTAQQDRAAPALAQLSQTAEPARPSQSGDTSPANEEGTALTASASDPQPQVQSGEVATPPASANASEADTTNPASIAASTETETPAQVTAALELQQADTPQAPAPVTSSPDISVTEGTPAPPKVAVLKSTATGVELLNTAPPEAMTNVALDTISYSDVGEVQLAGRAQSNTASVRVYLDNTSVINLPVDEQGRWRGELPDVDEGVYTLRVDEVSDTGKVTSRVETPFKRESTDVLVAAAAQQDGPISAITVQEGATLWAIARARYGDGALYVRVFEANSKAIRDPDLIYPGQVFDLPD